MKIKSLFVVFLLILTACNDPNIQQTAKNLGVENITDIGVNMFANAVQTECENQLQNNEAFANLVLTEGQKANLCGCTADELKANLSQDKLSSFLKDGSIDTKAISGVVTGAMATCTTRQPNIATMSSENQDKSKP